MKIKKKKKSQIQLKLQVVRRYTPQKDLNYDIDNMKHGEGNENVIYSNSNAYQLKVGFYKE